MDVDIFGDAEDDLGEEIARADTDEIVQRTRMLENEIKVIKNEVSRLNHEQQAQKERIKENTEKIKLNKILPYLVANVVEMLDMELEEEPEEDGANIDLDAHRKGTCCVLKTSTRQTIFLPVPGLVESSSLKPSDLVGVNKDSYLILEMLPSEFDSRVKAMEVDEKPTEEFNDVGGLDEQIQELIEAVVLPMTHKERFDNIGIKPPKGALMYGPPGTGKTLMARACAARTQACFLKLAGATPSALWPYWPSEALGPIAPIAPPPIPCRRLPAASPRPPLRPPQRPILTWGSCASQARSSCRCSSATAPSWCATLSHWPSRSSRPSSSSTSSTRWAPSASIRS